MSGTYIIILVQSCHWNGPINILAVIPTVTVKSLFSTCAAIGLEMVPQQRKHSCYFTILEFFYLSMFCQSGRHYSNTAFLCS